MGAPGTAIPPLAFGTWHVPDGGAAIERVGWALEAGYRHIDTAQRYANEAGVGRAIAGSGIPRADVFVTTKFDPALADPVDAAERSLERLDTGHIDLYLVHWPMDEPARHWARMLETQARGLARSIGVSNYGAAELQELCARNDGGPAVNQISLSPFQYRRALLATCERLGVTVAAHSPLTTVTARPHRRDRSGGRQELRGAAGRQPAEVLKIRGRVRGRSRSA